MQLRAPAITTLLLLAGSVQAEGTAAQAGLPAANVGPDFESKESVAGVSKTGGGDLTAQLVCPIEWPRPCPDGVLCCSDAYPWCCPNFCCPGAYPYCGNDGRCYSS